MKYDHHMNFSNQEIREYLIGNLRKNGISCTCIVDDAVVQDECDIPFECITFDGDVQEFFVNLYSGQISLFIHNEEFMFIDDAEREYYTSSDVQGNIVYEGELSAFSAEQVLTFLSDLIGVLNNSEQIRCTEILVAESDDRIHYPMFCYQIQLYNMSIPEAVYDFENIQISVVHHSF